MVSPESKAENIRRLIEHLKVDPQNLEMWFEMEKLYDDPGKRREILKGILLVDPENMQAKESLARLDAAVQDELAREEAQKRAEMVPVENIVENAMPETVVKRAPRGEENYRPCPFCAERIRVEAVKCRFCGEYLDGRERLAADATRQPAIRTVSLVVLAACSFIILAVLVFFVFLYFSRGSILPGN